MEEQKQNKTNSFYYYELYTHLKDRSKEDRDSFWVLVKHIAWKEIKKKYSIEKND